MHIGIKHGEYKHRTGFKRLVILCDGTWKEAYDKDGIDESTNVTRLTRAIETEDRSVSPHIPQIVFYQSGLGTSGDYSRLAGATGHEIVQKIKEAYEFIVQNWLPGDEILLFGVSRGAYTARMIGSLIGDIGVLTPDSMDDFNDFFEAYQNLGKGDRAKKAEAEYYLSAYRAGGSKAARSMPKKTLKCIGVWDTAGAFGIPGLTKQSSNYNLLGFVDCQLGKNVQYAFHALALNETRRDFVPTKWHQSAEQRRDGQVMKQVWFAGSHSDVGGGYADHELSDVTLVWMVANILQHKLLAVNIGHVLAIPSPKCSWGEMEPHDPSSGGRISFRKATFRSLPNSFDESTQEMIHSSVVARSDLTETLKRTLSHTESLITGLLPLELELKSQWKSSQSYEVREGSKDFNTSGQHQPHSGMVIVKPPKFNENDRMMFEDDAEDCDQRLALRDTRSFTAGHHPFELQLKSELRPDSRQSGQSCEMSESTQESNTTTQSHSSSGQTSTMNESRTTTHRISRVQQSNR